MRKICTMIGYMLIKTAIQFHDKKYPLCYGDQIIIYCDESEVN